MKYLRQAAVACGLVTVLVTPALAQSLHLDADGFVDLRLVQTPSERSWTDGGLGKLRYGGNGVDGQLLGGVEATLDVSPGLSAFADLRFDSSQFAPLSVLEAYARYQPVSTANWSWAVKGGLFFPPISLENDGPGWTGTWTITPSAINSWVGEELRTIGAESRLDYHDATGALSLTGALFFDNDPAGIQLANRGWSMGDVISGLPSKLRLPDLYAAPGSGPLREDPFLEIDDRVGWYAELAARLNDIGTIRLMRYDNEADPSAKRGVFAWRTDFWSLGVETHLGEVTLLAQAMKGNTVIAPFRPYYSDTDFRAAYLLAGWMRGDWRLAARADVFSTQEITNFPGEPDSEHGYALTGDVTWRATRWLKITGEALRIDSWRRQRLDEGQAPGTIDYQTTLNLRFLF